MASSGSERVMFPWLPHHHDNGDHQQLVVTLCGISDIAMVRTVGRGKVNFVIFFISAEGSFDPSSHIPHTTTAAYIRATGPKASHAPRTLYFLPPEKYQAEKRDQKARKLALMKEYMISGSNSDMVVPPARSFLAMQTLQFGGREIKNERGGGSIGERTRGEEKGRRASFGNSTTQYHSLADGMSGRSQFPRKRSSSVEIPVLPMNVLKSSPIKAQSPVNC